MLPAIGNTGAQDKWKQARQECKDYLKDSKPKMNVSLVVVGKDHSGEFRYEESISLVL